MNHSLPIKPSPNLRNDQAVSLYGSLCLFEGTNVSVARGIEKQFQIYGSLYLPKSRYSFTIKPNLGSKKQTCNGVPCFGENLSNQTQVNQLELK